MNMKLSDVRNTKRIQSQKEQSNNGFAGKRNKMIRKHYNRESPMTPLTVYGDGTPRRKRSERELARLNRENERKNICLSCTKKHCDGTCDKFGGERKNRE